MGLLAELVLIVVLMGVVGGLVASAAERASRPGTMSVRGMVAAAFAGISRSTRRVPRLSGGSSG